MSQSSDEAVIAAADDTQASIEMLERHCSHEWAEMQDADAPWTDITVPIHDLERVLRFARTAQAEASALRETLKSFAEIAESYSDSEDDALQMWKDFDVLGASLPLSIFRRARAALSEPKP